jgi:hypothetical protein
MTRRKLFHELFKEDFVRGIEENEGITDADAYKLAINLNICTVKSS